MINRIEKKMRKTNFEYIHISTILRNKYEYGYFIFVFSRILIRIIGIIVSIFSLLHRMQVVPFISGPIDQRGRRPAGVVAAALTVVVLCRGRAVEPWPLVGSCTCDKLVSAVASTWMIVTWR